MAWCGCEVWRGVEVTRVLRRLKTNECTNLENENRGTDARCGMVEALPQVRLHLGVGVGVGLGWVGSVLFGLA